MDIESDQIEIIGAGYVNESWISSTGLTVWHSHYLFEDPEEAFRNLEDAIAKAVVAQDVGIGKESKFWLRFEHDEAKGTDDLFAFVTARSDGLFSSAASADRDALREFLDSELLDSEMKESVPTGR